MFHIDKINVVNKETYNYFCEVSNRHKNKFSIMTPHSFTFRDFLLQDIPALELVETLDSTLLHLIVLLKYEPILLETILKLYETLYQLREFIKTHL